jgi:hypothetical protein
MKKLLVLAATVFTLAIGTGAVITVHSQPALADGTGGCSSC